jgi:hypothetical protein
METTMTTTKRINSTLPAATLAQRLAEMSVIDLMLAARELAKRTDIASEKACTAVLETLEGRISGQNFEAFVTEIYTQETK